MDRVFAEHGPIRSVIHFAGLKAVGESVLKPIEYYENNVGGTITLLKVMKKHNCNSIVFSSSATVYGSNPRCKETDATTGAINPYGQNKAMIEQILADIAKSNPAFSAICLRYFNPIGAHKSGEIGEDPKDIPNNLMPYIQRIAAGKLPLLSVFGTDYPTKDGTGVRDYIHVTDLARGHTAALSKQLRDNDAFLGWHAINLGTGNGTSVLELVAAFERASGITIEKKLVGRREGDVAQLLAVVDKAHELLGWKAELTIEDMCRDSWRWVYKNPNGYDD
jgi:UDP-glucose 4-epimerase